MSALSLVQERTDLADFGSPASAEEISDSELSLGVVLPKSYKTFLARLGAGDFDGHEFYGLISGNLRAEGVPNMLWLTQTMRKEMPWPPFQIPVYSTGTGSWVSLLCEENSPDFGRVCLLDPLGQFLKFEHADFAEFFYERIQQFD